MFMESVAPAPANHSGARTHDTALDVSAFSPLTTDNLRRTLLAEERPAAVICGAPWAAAWRAQLLELSPMCRGTDRRFAFYTLDVLREEELAGWVQVRVLPTTIIVRGHRIVARFSGLTPRREIRSALLAASFPRVS